MQTQLDKEKKSFFSQKIWKVQTIKIFANGASDFSALRMRFFGAKIKDERGPIFRSYDPH
jgi:hypothetical protein